MKSYFDINMLIICLVCFFSGCKNDANNTSSASDTLAYTKVQMQDQEAQDKVQQFGEALKNAGWCEIPKNALPEGNSNNDLVRRMVCIANAESRFGSEDIKDAYYGPWQLVKAHLGKQVTFIDSDGESYGYHCPAKSSGSFKDPDIAAKCSLYAYINMFKEIGDGLQPWGTRGQCTKTKANAKMPDDSFVFGNFCSE